MAFDSLAGLRAAIHETQPGAGRNLLWLLPVNGYYPWYGIFRGMFAVSLVEGVRVGAWSTKSKYWPNRYYRSYRYGYR